MNCQECFDKLHDFLDRELTPEVLQDIEKHLEECAPCLERFEFSGRLKAYIRTAASQDALPEGLQAKILAEIQMAAMAPVKAQRAAPRLTMLALAASLIMAFGINMGLVNGSPRSPVLGEMGPSVVRTESAPMLAALLQDHLACSKAAMDAPTMTASQAQENLEAGGLQVQLPHLPLGFDIVASRVCRLEGVAMGHLVLRKSGHLWSCFVSSTSQLAPDRLGAMQGDAVHRCRCLGRASMVMCVHPQDTVTIVSDQPLEDIRQVALASGL